MKGIRGPGEVVSVIGLRRKGTMGRDEDKFAMTLTPQKPSGAVS